MAVQSATGTRVKIATAQGSPVTISGATAANPCVLTATAHGLNVGAVIVITSVAGMTELNNRAFVVTAKTTNALTLGGVDSTGYTAYTSGGSATPQTMTEVVGPTGWERSGAPAAEIDATAMADVSRVRLAGLPDRGSVSMPVIIDITDPGQKAVRDAVGGDPIAMTVTLANGKASAVMVSWNNFTDSLTLDAAHKGEFSAYVSGEYSWYA